MEINEIIERALVHEAINLITDANAKRLTKAIQTALSEAGLAIMPRELIEEVLTIACIATGEEFTFDELKKVWQAIIYAIESEEKK